MDSVRTGDLPVHVRRLSCGERDRHKPHQREIDRVLVVSARLAEECDGCLKCLLTIACVFLQTPTCRLWAMDCIRSGDLPVHVRRRSCGEGHRHKPHRREMDRVLAVSDRLAEERDGCRDLLVDVRIEVEE